MNYEQKYKEALDKARDMMSYKEVRREDMEYLFPELKESEDEMIRKAIIEHFAGSHSSMFPYKGFTKEQILAWLEKQGEQKTTWKPTEEQIEALEHLLETIRRHEYSYFHEEKFISLHSLLEQLKKL